MSPLLWKFLFPVTGFLLGITIHEYCHALTAYLLGDHTAKEEGRLTLNPLAHIDPFGLLFLILVGFGWARPVPFNAQNFRFPRLYSVIVALAGPFSNLIIAFISLILLRTIPFYLEESWSIFFKLLFSIIAYINIMLSVFNLIPFPPLDGSHILRVLIPDQWEEYYATFQKYSIFLLIILINLPGFNKLLYFLIDKTTNFLQHLIDFLLL